MHIDQGWLSTATALASPNADPRPDKSDISLLVIHNISLPPGQFGGGHVAELFTNTLDPNTHPYFAEIANLKVSAHLLIDREGVVIQFVPFDQRAWHAGVSAFAGRPACNDFSIGIELEGTDTDPYTHLQYECLVKTTQCLIAEYPALNSERVAGHSDIAPDRKTDPGPAFDWARFKALI
ncbi:MAG: 1,6-anhydro-N-acetylmuramyl-L-alanine amidase AmpD [Porticoccaceae bacterium]|jgi:AmpD protein|nr:1,6-anhydro-N-acetylmuramyl-L-alanine amidase AmpD [Porticoccaceae bacterium]